MFCPKHPSRKPSRFVVHFGGHTRRFHLYKTAYDYLTELRLHGVSVATGGNDKALAFDRVVSEWLEVKRALLRPGGYRSLRSLILHCELAWRGRNIKAIDYRQVEILVTGLKLSVKTKVNLLGALKQFWKWAGLVYGVDALPGWPSPGRVEMAYRKTISLSVQESIIKNINEYEPWRVWVCVKWLATYIAVRPSEMLGLREMDIDRARGLLTIFDHKNPSRSVKIIPLTVSDQALIALVKPADDLSWPFFRHDGRRGHAPAGMAFRRQMIWAAWKRACGRLGIHGVDLYGGTKHSTAVGLRDKLGYEEVRKMTGHTTNRAFDRYIQLQGVALRGLYEVRQTLLDDSKLDLIKQDS